MLNNDDYLSYLKYSLYSKLEQKYSLEREINEIREKIDKIENPRRYDEDDNTSMDWNNWDGMSLDK